MLVNKLPLVFAASWLPSLVVGRALYGIDTNTFNRLRYFQQHAAAAYCDHNYEADQNKQVRCTDEACPWVERSNTRVIVSFTDDAKTDTSGYVAIDHTNRVLVMAVRGSESVRNFETALNVELEDNNMCDGCQTAAGFWSGWQAIRDATFPTIRAVSAQYPTYSIVTTGHSLGGTIATYAGVELRDEGHPVDIITFGAPRIGNEAFSHYITAQQTPGRGRNYRVTHSGDGIPSLPPQFMGYRHFSPEYVISAPVGQEVTREDVDVQDVDAEANGEVNWDISASVASHEDYFGAISRCYDGSLWTFGGMVPPERRAVGV